MKLQPFQIAHLKAPPRPTRWNSNPLELLAQDFFFFFPHVILNTDSLSDRPKQALEDIQSNGCTLLDKNIAAPERLSKAIQFGTPLLFSSPLFLDFIHGDLGKMSDWH